MAPPDLATPTTSGSTHNTSLRVSNCCKAWSLNQSRAISMASSPCSGSSAISASASKFSPAGTSMGSADLANASSSVGTYMSISGRTLRSRLGEVHIDVRLITRRSNIRVRHSLPYPPLNQITLGFTRVLTRRLQVKLSRPVLDRFGKTLTSKRVRPRLRHPLAAQPLQRRGLPGLQSSVHIEHKSGHSGMLLMICTQTYMHASAMIRGAPCNAMLQSWMSRTPGHHQACDHTLLLR